MPEWRRRADWWKEIELPSDWLAKKVNTVVGSSQRHLEVGVRESSSVTTIETGGSLSHVVKSAEHGAP